MIGIGVLQLRRISADALRQLHVDDTTEVQDIRELTDGTWMVAFVDRSPDTRFPGFDVSVQREWSPAQTARRLRLELRQKLWVCPLCQHRASIRRIVDREAFRVLCERCGRFEIDSVLLNDFRVAYEDNDSVLVEALSRLSQTVPNARGSVVLTADTWRTFVSATGS
jgi:hypothetical protein